MIRRLIGSRADQINLSLTRTSFSGPFVTFEAKSGKLKIHATSEVDLCSGFYQYLKSQGLGMRTWAGKSLRIPKRWPDCEKTTLRTPFRYRPYFNAVTYGYTMPYWDWNRWEEELDWMALHGINMPLMLVANEAIATRVWRSIGLTEPEINQFYTGPAYLPWHRMGNLTNHNGPLSNSWHSQQVRLAHRILKRMRELGMRPITPGFSGFVPKGISRLHPREKLARFSWGGFAPEKQSYFLSADSLLFADLTGRFIASWEKEFKAEPFRLVDSFNEMELPASGLERETFLAEYGQSVYASMKAANPDSKWVIQGWMFGYQREIWNRATVEALFRKVPKDKVLVLDMACDYNGTFWHNEMNWKVQNEFSGVPWVYGTIPNMGGKTGYTGILNFYRKDVFKALTDPSQKHLAGFGIFPEGLENNEIIYELLTDNIWRSEPFGMDDFLFCYCRARYGAAPEAAVRGWKLLTESCYATFTDHPRFGWQYGSTGKGSMNKDPRFAEGVRLLASCASQLKGATLYRPDLIEQAAMIAGSRAEDLFGQAMSAAKGGDVEQCKALWARAQTELLLADRLLESHPNHRLKRWLDFARHSGASSAESDRYERDARRIVTVWGPPVNDYSARLWGGLIRDFYVPRMELRLKAALGEKVDVALWEEKWVNSLGVSAVKPFDDPLRVAAREMGL